MASTLKQYGLDLKTPDNEGRTPLSWAAGHGHKAVVNILAECGSNTGRGDLNGLTPLWWAATSGHASMVELPLKEYGADAKRGDRNGETALSRALFEGYDDVSDILRQKTIHNEEPESASTGYDDLLWWAVKGGHEAVVQQLLQLGVDPNAARPRNSRPLIWAAASGHDKIVEDLVDKGANVEAVAAFCGDDDASGTPLWWAARNGHGHLEIAKTLIDFGFNVLQAQPSIELAREKFGVRGDVGIVDCSDTCDRNLISWAAQVGHTAAILLLLAILPRADINLSERDRRRPLAWADENGHDTIVQLLGAKVIFFTDVCHAQPKDVPYNNPVALAVRQGHRRIALQLLDKWIEKLGKGQFPNPLRGRHLAPPCWAARMGAFVEG